MYIFGVVGFASVLRERKSHAVGKPIINNTDKRQMHDTAILELNISVWILFLGFTAVMLNSSFAICVVFEPCVFIVL